MPQITPCKKILTISIPTWNRSDLLKELIEQLIKQILKFNLENKIEVLISNNGSEDSTEEMVNNFREKCLYISYNNNVVNIGARANVLKCMELASGEYVMVLGDDDRISKNCLVGLINYLENNIVCGLVIDCAKFKKSSFGNTSENTDINLITLLEHFYWHMGNAGIFVMKTSFVKDNLKKHPYEYFSLSWPQTQLMILGLFQNKNLKCRLGKFDIISEAIHGQVMIYTSYYLFRTCYYDLYNAVEDIRNEIDESTVNAAKKYLSDNILQLFYNVLQCGIFLDDRETKKRTADLIKKSTHNYSSKEKIYLKIIVIAFSLPSSLAKTISNIFIYSIRGKKGIDKKNEFVNGEMIKKEEMKNRNNLVIREFQF